MSRASQAKSVSYGLAAAFLDGPWIVEAMVERGADALGRRHRSLRPLARKAIIQFPERPDGRLETLAAFVRATWRDSRVQVRHWRQPPASMAAPLPALRHLAALPLTCVGDIAGWLGLESSRLVWYADIHHQLRRGAQQKLRHYRYAWVPKRSGAYRLLEAPKPVLKEIQRRILREIVEILPPHPAAHGFRRGRSVLSNAKPHVGNEVVVRLDLADFFAAVTATRVRAVFRSLGYPDGVVRVLAGLCCTATPSEVLSAYPVAREPAEVSERREQRQRLAGPHLPQGAPTSPALANLVAFRLDRRLAGLAVRWEARYTRYADDLAFSGDRRLAARVHSFIGRVAAIAEEEGFAVRLRKTRVMRQARRQQIAGIVVNERPSLARADLERLEAILYNCVRYGPGSQNREAHRDFHGHLVGRVSWVEQVGPRSRATRLRDLLNQIQW